MTVSYTLPDGIDLAGSKRVDPRSARRQQETAREILRRFAAQPGIVLADEVGMGKTFVAFAVATGVMTSTRGEEGPVVVAVPPHMLRKWQDDWRKYLNHCVKDGDLRRELFDRSASVDDVTGLLRLLDDPSERRKWLVFVKVSAFTSELKRSERWIKLALVQKAFARNSHLSDVRPAFERWASYLLEGQSKGLSRELVSTLLDTPACDWKQVIDAADVEAPLDDDPIPAAIADSKHQGDLQDLYAFLRELPVAPKRVSDERQRSERQKFAAAARAAFRCVLQKAAWHTPLLILDEAHHLKNPATVLHSLFHDSSKEGIDYLKGCFERMLFLTATPFQLGHFELLNVLRLFLSVRWNHARAPHGGIAKFDEMLKALQSALDEAQRCARRLEANWSELTTEHVASELGAAELESFHTRELLVEAWWRAIHERDCGSRAYALRERVAQAREKKEQAETHLRPWVLRHNRERTFAALDTDGAPRSRRALHPGQAIESVDVRVERADGRGAIGLDLHGDAMLPFLLSIRAQAELARSADGGRAYFAEGLASSYEAFHHTRAKGVAALDADADETTKESAPDALVTWYSDRIGELVPAAASGDPRARKHPKMAATVRRVVDLWARGEKVLVFCFYIQTARALRVHISEELERRMVAEAARKLGLDADEESGRAETWATLERISERCARPDTPFNRELKAFVRGRIESAFGKCELAWLSQLGQALHRFLRSFSYVARYFPLEDARFAASVQHEARVDEEALRAFRLSLEARDGSGASLSARVDAFLSFVKEKWDDQGRGELQAESELDRYLAAFERMQFRSKAAYQAHEENFEGEGGKRVLANVRAVTGDGMTPDQRDIVMRAFNSPLFPEILVASQVLAEGVDLHRCCRFVIHHDLSWNPSTLEQRNGRVDRIQGKSEQTSRPIHIFEPFIAETADEKMYRVVKDRERWFQVVMGDDFKLSEATTEKRLERLPLPASIAESLSFELGIEGHVSAEPGVSHQAAGARSARE